MNIYHSVLNESHTKRSFFYRMVRKLSLAVYQPIFRHWVCVWDLPGRISILWFLLFPSLKLSRTAVIVRMVPVHQVDTFLLLPF